MNEIRTAYLDTAEIGLHVLIRGEIGEGWGKPSALEHWTLGGLCGHLARAVTTVLHYLSGPAADGPPVTPAEYYATVMSTQDLQSALHKGIRQRGEEMAAKGHDSLVPLYAESLTRVRSRLEDEPAGRLMQVHQGMVVALDDYLVTRLIELVVHIDDVCRSIGVETPPLPKTSTRLAISGLVDVARHRHGDLNVLRALARRERDDVNALRVL